MRFTVESAGDKKVVENIYRNTLLTFPSLAEKSLSEMHRLAAALLDSCGTNIDFKREVCHGILEVFPVLAAQYPTELPYLIKLLLDRCDGNAELKQKILKASINTFPAVAREHYPEVAPLAKSLFRLHNYKDAELAVIPELMRHKVVMFHVVQTLLGGYPVIEKDFLAGRMPNGGALAIAPLNVGEERICSAVIEHKGRIIFSFGHLNGTVGELTAKSERIHGIGTPKHNHNINFIQAAEEVAQNPLYLPPLSEVLYAATHAPNLTPAAT